MSNKLIINAVILTMEDAVYDKGFLLIENGRIAAAGPMEMAPDKPAEWGETVDAAGGYLMPGLIDAHTHLGLYEDSLGFEGADGNEDTDPVTPHLRVIDAINPMERAFAEARAAGVTTALVSPGSANPLGGQAAVIRTAGRRIDDMIVRAPAAMKFALGENPKTVYHDKEEAPVTRMATAALLREHLTKAQEYDRQKQRAAEDEDTDEPDFDAKMEAMLPLLHGEIDAHFHAHRADDIFTALRICREFGIRPVIVHGTEGHVVADILAEEKVPVISGPFMTDRSKPELSSLTDRAPGILSKAGILTAITTDHPEIPLKYFRNAALIAVQAGMDEMEALKALTIYSARILHLDEQTGSLKAGKDADIVWMSDHPFSYKSRICAVYSRGECIYREDENENS